MKFYEIFEIYIVNLTEMTNRQNSGVIFRFSKVRLGSVLLRRGCYYELIEECQMPIIQ